MPFIINPPKSKRWALPFRDGCRNRRTGEKCDLPYKNTRQKSRAAGALRYLRHGRLLPVKGRVTEWEETVFLAKSKKKLLWPFLWKIYMIKAYAEGLEEGFAPARAGRKKTANRRLTVFYFLSACALYPGFIYRPSSNLSAARRPAPAGSPF